MMEIMVNQCEVVLFFLFKKKKWGTGDTNYVSSADYVIKLHHRVDVFFFLFSSLLS